MANFGDYIWEISYIWKLRDSVPNLGAQNDDLENNDLENDDLENDDLENDDLEKR